MNLYYGCSILIFVHVTYDNDLKLVLKITIFNYD